MFMKYESFRNWASKPFQNFSDVLVEQNNVKRSRIPRVSNFPNCRVLKRATLWSLNNCTSLDVLIMPFFLSLHLFYSHLRKCISNCDFSRFSSHLTDVWEEWSICKLDFKTLTELEARAKLLEVWLSFVTVLAVLNEHEWECQEQQFSQSFEVFEIWNFEEGKIEHL